MTQEKKYKEALERAKKGECLESIFPELRESEDESIRKEIISFLEGFYANKNKDRWIDWLEKQRHEGKKWIYEDVYIKEKEQVFQDGIDEVLENPQKYGLEKQGEQKPINNIEPKFKIEKGKWYICIRDLYDNYATRAFCKGRTYHSTKDETLIPDNSYIPFEIKYCVNDYFRLWTIQDVKDGDILEFADHGRLVIGIVSHVNIVTGKVDVNCLLEGNNFKLGNYYALDTFKPHLATKEQCDLLFNKMKELGFKWDAEKKELKKIEPKFKVGDIIRIKGSLKEYTIESISGECYHGKGWGLLIGCDNDYELVEHKSTWSEEDERILEGIINEIEANKAACPEYDEKVYDMFLSWLKSLKDRVQQ